MLGAKNPLSVGEGALLQLERLGGAAYSEIDIGQIVPRIERVAVVGAEDSFSVCEVALVQLMGFGESADEPVGVGQVVACPQGIQVIRAKDLFQFRKQSFANGDALRGTVPELIQKVKGLAA